MKEGYPLWDQERHGGGAMGEGRRLAWDQERHGGGAMG